MDGKADDCLLDGNGDLVMLDDSIDVSKTTISVLDGGTVLAVVLQGVNGDIGVQVYGAPSKELVTALHTATRGLLSTLRYGPECCNQLPEKIVVPT